MTSNKYHQFGIRSENGVYTGSDIHSVAEIYGSPKIIHSKIHSGKILDRAKLIDVTVAGLPVISGEPTIMRSFVGGGSVITGFPYIYDSYVDGEVVISGGVTIEHSEVLGSAKVLDMAVLSNVIIDKEAMVSGTAKVLGTPEQPINLTGWNYIHRGVWHRPPIHKVAPKSGFVLTECTDGHVDIGCICNKPEKFLRAGYRYMETLGFTKEQTDEIKDLLTDLQKEIKEYAS